MLEEFASCNAITVEEVLQALAYVHADIERGYLKRVLH